MNNLDPKLVMPHERVDDLQLEGLKIIQDPKGFCFGIDAVLLSHFVKVKRTHRIVEFGTGTGIIPILLAGKTQFEHLYAFEVQEEVADMASRSVKLNHLEDKIEIIRANLKAALSYLDKGTIDTVVSNPPYMSTDGGIKNPSDKKAISRHEVLCTLEDVIVNASVLLKPSGNLYMIHRPNRLADLIYLCKQNKLEPKEIRMIQPYAHKKPNIFLIRCTKGGRPDLKFHDPLIVRTDQGDYTKEIYDIYGMENITVFE
ncbi:tRNA1(Val) (adenine(37)-N6)-methyltransferase [Fusibacter sp. 3D3]|uniref:tRNA1(Val) (adenine(37)-N6)-methyltransferase n=1 Tax=Fusibacter sp. 3D3 TaxID=1048380 RepID=UPI00085330C6|nr:tRNA1(Val) (adenine(37)-N6)-methyltransferase [Fusibacter sp. 3D3]GAU76867.1 tRNA (adenine37-N(6))-methyltransferase [Fusibacter sp. 3D3]